MGRDEIQVRLNKLEAGQFKMQCANWSKTDHFTLTYYHMYNKSESESESGSERERESGSGKGKTKAKGNVKERGSDVPVFSAFNTTHPNLLRGYLLDYLGGTARVVYEGDFITLDQWLAENSTKLVITEHVQVYETISDPAVESKTKAVSYVSDNLKRMIKELVLLLIDMHENREEYFNNFNHSNVAVVNKRHKDHRSPPLWSFKLFGVKLCKFEKGAPSNVTDPLKWKNFDCLSSLIFHIFGGLSIQRIQEKVPKDMISFMNHLNLRINRIHILLAKHPSLISIENLACFISIVQLKQHYLVTELGSNQMFYKAMNAIGGEFAPLPEGHLVDAFRDDNKHKVEGAADYFRFLRNFITHLLEKEKNEEEEEEGGGPREYKLLNLRDKQPVKWRHITLLLLASHPSFVADALCEVFKKDVRMFNFLTVAME